MYFAKAIRILAPEASKPKPDVIYITETNCPNVGIGWTMHEETAREKYQITNLQIDESKAVTLDEKNDLVFVSI